jgi:prevent-host-death family protein
MGKAQRFMVKTLPITKARINFGELVRKVHTGKDRFVIEKGGIPVVAIIDIEEFEDFLEIMAEQNDPELQTQIREGWQEYKAGKTRSLDEALSSLDAEDSNKEK